MKLLHPNPLIPMPCTAAIPAEPDFGRCFDFRGKSTGEIDRSETGRQRVCALLTRGVNAQDQKNRDWPTAFNPDPTAG